MKKTAQDLWTSAGTRRPSPLPTKHSLAPSASATAGGSTPSSATLDRRNFSSASAATETSSSSNGSQSGAAAVAAAGRARESQANVSTRENKSASLERAAAANLSANFGADPSAFESEPLSPFQSANGTACSELDDTDGTTADPQRTKAAIDHYQAKIRRTMQLIQQEQKAKEENVDEYLQLSTSSSDKQQLQRIKTLFEKKNLKSTQSISHLSKKLEVYKKKLSEAQKFGVSSHKQAKEVLRDVGQGLKDVGANIRDGITGFSGGMVDNIRGAKDHIVNKPKEFAHLLKNKFGSADNIANLKQYEGEGGSTDDVIERHSNHGSTNIPVTSGSFKYRSEDEVSSVTSESGPSADVYSSPHPHSGSNKVHSAPSQQVDLEPLLREVQLAHSRYDKLFEAFETYKNEMEVELNNSKQVHEEDKFHIENLEEQINDLTELHQNEVTNIKQELTGMEEKMEYQLEERTRDMQELLESCQTKITKMELQQQQQHLISMEGIENTNFRAVLTKLINVLLALLAVVLVFVSTIANLVGPFLTTRLRILSTICLVAVVAITWQNWTIVQNTCLHFYDKYLFRVFSLAK